LRCWILGGVVFQSTGNFNETIDWEVIFRLNNIYGHDLNIGKDVFPVFMKEYNRFTHQQLKGQVFLKNVFDILQINQELIDLLSAFYPLVIVSDNYRENITYIAERYQFASWSEKQIYSFDYGMVKGDPRFFAQLLQETSYETANLIFIDDSIEKIKSAAAHGILGIHYVNNTQLRKELTQVQDSY
jgi:FMN phosphatase YigB (HAD superfamily)